MVKKTYNDNDFIELCNSIGIDYYDLYDELIDNVFKLDSEKYVLELTLSVKAKHR